MSTKQLAITILVSIFIGVVIGFFIANRLTVTAQIQIQEGLTISAIGSIAIFFIKLLWDVNKLPEFQVTHYIWKYKDRHPIHQQAENIKVLTLYVKNVGGGDITERCVADIMIDGEMPRTFALHWLHLPRNLQNQNSGVAFQKHYVETGDKNFVISGIEQNRDEIIDVLFTLDKEKEVFLLDSHQTILLLREEPYNVSIAITAKNPICTVKFKLAIPNWENINVREFTVINHTMRAKLHRLFQRNKKC